MKCNKCGQDKPEEAFYKHPGNSSGRQGHCIECAKAINNARYHARPEVIAARQAHIDKYGPQDQESIYQRKIKRSNECRYRRVYGITIADRDRMLTEQNGCCKICGVHHLKAPPCSGSLGLYVDHCHKTGKVRGLLCKRCNSGIGFLDDSVDLLGKAKEYLENA